MIYKLINDSINPTSPSSRPAPSFPSLLVLDPSLSSLCTLSRSLSPHLRRPNLHAALRGLTAPPATSPRRFAAPPRGLRTHQQHVRGAAAARAGGARLSSWLHHLLPTVPPSSLLFSDGMQGQAAAMAVAWLVAAIGRKEAWSSWGGTELGPTRGLERRAPCGGM